METLTNVSPFLAPLPDEFEEGMIAFKAPKLLLCVPLPPWSTADDLDETSGLIVIDQPPAWISWEEDLGMDGYNRFRIQPRSEPIESCCSLYAIGCGPSAKAGSSGMHRIGVSNEGGRSCGINLFQDPFGRSRTTVQAFCALSSPQSPVLLEHTEWFDAFDFEDEEKWPIPREVMMQRVRRVRRVRAMPAPAA